MEVARAVAEELTTEVDVRLVSSRRQASISEVRVTSFCRRSRERKEPYSATGNALIKAMQARSLSKASKLKSAGQVSFMAPWAAVTRMQSEVRDSDSAF